ncbi:hypothetical protein ACJX0J_023085, partial [Zea mays]
HNLSGQLCMLARYLCVTLKYITSILQILDIEVIITYRVITNILMNLLRDEQQKNMNTKYFVNLWVTMYRSFYSDFYKTSDIHTHPHTHIHHEAILPFLAAWACLHLHIHFKKVKMNKELGKIYPVLTHYFTCQ